MRSAGRRRSSWSPRCRRLLLAALVALQLLAAGYAMTLADGAAEAGALALASGGSAAEAARGGAAGLGRGRRRGLGRGRQGDGAAAAALAVARARRPARGDQRRQREAGASERPTRSATRPRCWSPRWAGPRASRGAAAALACAGADVDRAALLVDVGGRAPRPTLLASAAARRLEERLAAHLPQARVAARGQVCHLAVAADRRGLAAAAAAVTVARGALAVVHLPPALLQPCSGARGMGRGRRASCCAPTSPPTGRCWRWSSRDLLARGLAVGVLKHRLSWVAERRALFGALGVGCERRTAARLLRTGCCRTSATVGRMAREMSQRELRNQSGEIMRELDRGEEFVITSNGVPVGELRPDRKPPFRLHRRPSRSSSPVPAGSTTSASEKTSTVTSIRIRRLASGVRPDRGLLDTSVVIGLDEVELSRLPQGLGGLGADPGRVGFRAARGGGRQRAGASTGARSAGRDDSSNRSRSMPTALVPLGGSTPRWWPAVAKSAGAWHASI